MFLAFLMNSIVKKTLLLIVVAQIHNVANGVTIIHKLHIPKIPRNCWSPSHNSLWNADLGNGAGRLYTRINQDSDNYITRRSVLLID